MQRRKTRKRKSDILYVSLTFGVIVAVFAAASLGHDPQNYDSVNVVIISILALPPTLLSFVISSTFLLPAQLATDALFIPFAALYWMGMSYAVVKIISFAKITALRIVASK